MPTVTIRFSTSPPQLQRPQRHPLLFAQLVNPRLGVPYGRSETPAQRDRRQRERGKSSRGNGN